MGLSFPDAQMLLLLLLLPQEMPLTVILSLHPSMCASIKLSCTVRAVPLHTSQLGVACSVPVVLFVVFCAAATVCSCSLQVLTS
jgi:hypothetical protein